MKSKFFILLQYCLPQHFLSRLIGKLANWQMPCWLKNYLISYFIRRHNIDMDIVVEKNLNYYKTFNEFFTRKIKPEVRPIASGNAIVSPADGTISQIGTIKQTNIIQAKNIDYRLSTLLANNAHLTNTFCNGQFATIYLSPRDYHRVHMPCDGKLQQSIYVPGKLFSVNPIMVKHVDNIFANNERLINIFQTKNGPIAVILVGAMLVAGIETVWQGKIAANKSKQIQTWNYTDKTIFLQKGEQLGLFNFGSTTIILFPKNVVEWDASLTSGSSVQMGQSLTEV